MNQRERRAQPRFDINLGAEVTCERKQFTAATRDVSTGGCCLEGPTALVEGETVGVALFLVVDGIEESDFPPLRVRATVQWTAEMEEGNTSWKHLAGLKFLNITDAQTQWLDGVLKRAGA
jgi:c-di-GMP-binding flagellar brake protein YcgR